MSSFGDCFADLVEMQLHCFGVDPWQHERCSRWLYKQRNAIERFFNKLKHFRAIATRYDKRDDNYLASIKLASLRIWLRFNESVT